MPTNGQDLPAYCISERFKVGDKTMKVLLTGGSGNLGQTVVPRLLDKDHTPVILDLRAPPRPLNEGAVFIEGSILDRSRLTEMFRGCDCVVHIAAWHGIHEDRGEKDAYDFFDLNVRGTFEVFEGAASAPACNHQHWLTAMMPNPDLDKSSVIRSFERIGAPERTTIHKQNQAFALANRPCRPL
jgi:hypothetical protein